MYFENKKMSYLVLSEFQQLKGFILSSPSPSIFHEVSCLRLKPSHKSHHSFFILFCGTEIQLVVALVLLLAEQCQLMVHSHGFLFLQTSQPIFKDHLLQISSSASQKEEGRKKCQDASRSKQGAPGLIQAKK